MLELEAARERILALMPPPQPERIELAHAFGRILAERVIAPLDLPGFDNSAMDGYAVRAADVQSATEQSPALLKLTGRVCAGELFPGELKSGECVRIFTGSPIPRGADAVMMQEDTRVETSQPEVVSVLDAVKPWNNIRFRGEDLKSGAMLGEPGDEITAGRISLLAAMGLTHALVAKRPVVGLLATGSELIEAGQPLPPGKIYESNRRSLATLITLAGAIPKIFPLVPDSLVETKIALEKAFQECDLVMTSGGVSVGDMDFVKDAFAGMGGVMEFWKVAMRPGRPFVFGRWKEKFLFGLPGNPVSAFVTFLLLARPALRRWQGASEIVLPEHPARLQEPLCNRSDYRHFMRVVVDHTGNARPAGMQGSHIMSGLAAANGLADVPPKTTLDAGTTVRVMRWH
jgi:molybdopterin molybdotransferase